MLFIAPGPDVKMHQVGLGAEARGGARLCHPRRQKLRIPVQNFHDPPLQVGISPEAMAQEGNQPAACLSANGVDRVASLEFRFLVRPLRMKALTYLTTPQASLGCPVKSAVLCDTVVEQSEVVDLEGLLSMANRGPNTNSLALGWR